MQLSEAQFERYPITTDIYHQMIKQGILTSNDKIELLEGDLIKMSAMGPRHLASINRLTEFFILQLQGTVMVSTQGPVELSQFSEPEPDVSLLKKRADYYRSAIPKAEDALLVIEVADTTLSKDRGVKLSAYARAKIVEFWIVNLQDDIIEVYTNPTGSSYQTVRIVHRHETLSPVLLPAVILEADDVLG